MHIGHQAKHISEVAPQEGKLYYTTEKGVSWFADPIQALLELRQKRD